MELKFICGFNKQSFIFNTQDLNIILQNIFNPLNEDFEFDLIRRNCKFENGYSFRVNDKIIRTENDYNSNVTKEYIYTALVIYTRGSDHQIHSFILIQVCAHYRLSKG